MAQRSVTIDIVRGKNDIAACVADRLGQILEAVQNHQQETTIQARHGIVEKCRISSTCASSITPDRPHVGTTATIVLDHTELPDLTESLHVNANYQYLFVPHTSGPDLEIQILSNIAQSDQNSSDRESLVSWASHLSLQNEYPIPLSFVAAIENGIQQPRINEICHKHQQNYPNASSRSVYASESTRAVFGADDCIILGEFDENTLPVLDHAVVRTHAVLRRASNVDENTLQPLTHYVLPSLQTGKIHLSDAIRCLCDTLELSCGLQGEARSIWNAFRRTIDPKSRIGSDLLPTELCGQTSEEVFFRAFLEHLTFFMHTDVPKNVLRCHGSLDIHLDRPKVRPMNLIEKILTHSAVGLQTPEVFPGQMIGVSVDWVLTSELLWGGMKKTYNRMNRPRLHRNDRVWLAVDHTVDPRTVHRSKQQELIKESENFRDEAKIVNFLPANTSIMHTDFTREKAQPGKIVVGSDSHTCSAGSMGSFAVGFGAADVVMPMVTGETWFRVPEVCRIDFVGQLSCGVTGKDVILHILGVFKRNTIAFQRAVEYGGPSLGELSMDARFAIANMTTEFGGMGSCFEADEMTAQWIARRKLSRDRRGGIYFQPDANAKYAVRQTIDLSSVEHTLGLYPNPDDIMPVTSKAGMQLNGCFIGACTTAEEELVLAALVLEAGLKKGLTPVQRGKRRVTPGSLVIIEALEKEGLLDIYDRAGFEVGAPGCSYCVGINDVDVAQEGEVWLSSQNRNFRNRMGKGSIGNITSAATVAASSFSMEVTDPKALLASVDLSRLRRLTEKPSRKYGNMPSIQDPRPLLSQSDTNSGPNNNKGHVESAASVRIPTDRYSHNVSARIQRFGKNVDTDAVIPAEFMPGVDDADLGSHCFEYFRPDFREKSRNGSSIIVAEEGFGSGSSREDAVRALKGAGVEAVIAKSYAFIYERNQLNMGLFNAVVTDEEFYAHATEGRAITLDKNARTLTLDGHPKVFRYSHSQIEDTLLRAGGILNLYDVHGKDLFRRIVTQESKADESTVPALSNGTGREDKSLKW